MSRVKTENPHSTSTPLFEKRSPYIIRSMEIIKEGSLEKKSSCWPTKRWQPRYFVIHGNHLLYCKGKSWTETPSIGSCDLKGLTIDWKGGREFVLQQQKQSAALRAKTTHIAQDWVDKLQIIVGKLMYCSSDPGVSAGGIVAAAKTQASSATGYDATKKSLQVCVSTYSVYSARSYDCCTFRIIRFGQTA